MINKTTDLELIEAALEFANLLEIESARQVEAIFERTQHVANSPIWKKLPDPNDTKDFQGLRRELYGWLGDITAGEADVAREMLRRYQEKSTLKAIIPFVTLKGEIASKDIYLWGLPQLSFDMKGNLKIDAIPFLSGVESAVYFSLILIFAHGLERKIACCPAPLPDDRTETCGAFYLRTKERWAAHSPECYQEYRRVYVLDKVKDYWKEHPRSKAKKKDIKEGKGRSRRQQKRSQKRRKK